MDVDEINDMITECCDAPDATTCKKAGHLWNQAWLCRNNLVNRNAVARLDLIIFANGARLLSLHSPRPTMSGTKLAGGTKWQFRFAIKEPLGKVPKLSEEEDL